MKDTLKNSESFRKAVEELKPHWDEITQQFERDVREYNELFKTDSADFGQIIKCHLISEIYLAKYWSHQLSLPNLSDARLTHYQMVMLLPEQGAAPALFKPGLLTLNALRNKFAHNLQFTLSKKDLSTMTGMLIMSERPIETMNAIEMVEKFTALSCASLSPTPEKIADIFAAAMKHLKPEDLSR